MSVPGIALGGVKGLGDKVGHGLRRVAHHVTAHTVPDCGHFVPEERPDVVVEQIRVLAARLT